MNEEDVEMSILTWHYDRYEKSKNPQWSVIAKDGVGTYFVQFEYKGKFYQAEYDDTGQILVERMQYNPSEIPQPVIEILDYRVVKYKVESFIRQTSFESKKPSEVEYFVMAITKSGGKVIFWFDEGFSVLPDRRDELAFKE